MKTQSVDTSLLTAEREVTNTDAILKKLATEPEAITAIGMHSNPPQQWPVPLGPSIEDYVLKTLPKLNTMDKVKINALLDAYRLLGVHHLRLSSRVPVSKDASSLIYRWPMEMQ
jgi:hypothetical protein